MKPLKLRIAWPTETQFQLTASLDKRDCKMLAGVLSKGYQKQGASLQIPLAKNF